MICHRIAFPLLAVLALAACGDSSPTAANAPVDEAAFELLAEGALEANDVQGTPLPSLDHLLRRAYKAIRDKEPGYERARRLLRSGQTLPGIVAVLGPDVAVEAMAGVSQALARVEDHFAGKTLPDRIKRILAQAKNTAARGDEALAAGRPVAALGAALASADLIRSLSPRFQARKAIDRATRAYKAAREAVGDSPTEAEMSALKKAYRFGNGAKDAFKAKEYRKAWNYAKKSLALSQKVLGGRSGG